VNSNQEATAESWAERCVGPVEFRNEGGSMGWNPREGPTCPGK